MQTLWVLHQEQGQSTWTPTLYGRAEQGLGPNFSFLCFPCQPRATCSLVSGQGLCGSHFSQIRRGQGWRQGRLQEPGSMGAQGPSQLWLSPSCSWGFSRTGRLARLQQPRLEPAVPRGD